MKKYITVAIFSLFFFSLFISPALADSELSNLTQQRNRVEVLKQRIVTLIDLAENKNRKDVVFILQELLISAENILGKIENKVEDVFDGWNTYRNEEYGFEIKYPGDWLIEEERVEVGLEGLVKEQVETLYMVNRFISDEDFMFRPMVTIYNNKKKRSLEEWLDVYSYNSATGSFLIERKEVLIAGKGGLKGGFGSSQSFQQSVFLKKESNIYMIAGGFLKEFNEYEYEEIFSRIISTFRFLN